MFVLIYNRRDIHPDHSSRQLCSRGRSIFCNGAIERDRESLYTFMALITQMRQLDEFEIYNRH